MFTVRHATFKLRIMEIIDIPWEIVTGYLWKTSDFIMKHKLKKEDLEIEPLEVCILDPGGMLNMKEEWKEFNIGKYKFEVQLSKIDWVILKVKKAQERIPNGMRFGMWRWNVVCSKKLHGQLLEKLIALSKTDEALHCQLDDFEIKKKLEDGGYMTFPEIPRE